MKEPIVLVQMVLEPHGEDASHSLISRHPESKKSFLRIYFLKACDTCVRMPRLKVSCVTLTLEGANIVRAEGVGATVGLSCSRIPDTKVKIFGFNRKLKKSLCVSTPCACVSVCL